MFARIYVPARNATQSGRASKESWVLEYEPEVATKRDPVMGWPSSSDMRSQIRMVFASKEEAVAYAERNGIPFQVVSSVATKRRYNKRTYADNFSFSRKKGWTH